MRQDGDLAAMWSQLHQCGAGRLSAVHGLQCVKRVLHCVDAKRLERKNYDYVHRWG